MKSQQQPLHGIRVVEQGSFITGPYASMLLADMGADVIKVERPGSGDIFRTYDGTLYSPTFQAFNRNKRSITLDNRDADDQRVMRDLIATADVYIQNFRPGVAERLGVGPDDLHEINPRLIYCAISGFGATGPYVNRPAYDTVAQAVSGLLSMTLDPAQPRIAGPAIADAVTGLYAAQGVLAALVQRGNDNHGHVVEISMLEAMTNFLTEPFTAYFGSGETPGPYGRAAISQSFAVQCRDGKGIALHLSSPEKFWTGLLAALDRPELARDVRFADRMDRVANHELLRQELQLVFATKDQSAWLQTLIDNDVPSAPIHELGDVLTDPQFQHLQLEVSARHDEHGDLRAIRPAITFDHHIVTDIIAPPSLGEHSTTIRRELSPAECIDPFAAQGAS